MGHLCEEALQNIYSLSMATLHLGVSLTAWAGRQTCVNRALAHALKIAVWTWLHHQRLGLVTWVRMHPSPWVWAWVSTNAAIAKLLFLVVAVHTYPLVFFSLLFFHPASLFSFPHQSLLCLLSLPSTYCDFTWPNPAFVTHWARSKASINWCSSIHINGTALIYTS